ncbi:IS1595 family transposase [Paenibacillus thiaminolyticus]|uniref:IS1595 family transposase n=1 Tax=Paenibacillus thiaminolyticus TaxID=49283 RepID=UPI00254395B7|nr:IS1595 family transposase [Paenibacillus thiaminolyticus]WII36614.1 IS1595 family transposase [Paenibacillus thiaminolyticus]
MLDKVENIATLEELYRRFPTESACADYLVQWKWPHGFSCPRCKHHTAYMTKTRRLPIYECRACRHQTTPTVGTVMEGSRTPLRKWMAAFWLFSRAEEGINAVRLRSLIQVTYKTAWSMLHKIRATVSHAHAKKQLSGDVQGIVVFYGRAYRPSVELHPGECALIVAESIEPEGELSQLKMTLVDKKHVIEKRLYRTGSEQFINDHVEPNSTDRVSIIDQFFRVRRNSPLYQTFRQACRWLNDTFHGIGPKYLQRYVDEFIFHKNLDNTVSPWTRLLSLCVSVGFRSFPGNKPHTRPNAIHSKSLAA